MIDDDSLTLIRRKAREVQASWPDCAVDDLIQELCIKWMESYAKWSVNDHPVGVRDYLEDEDVKRGQSKINVMLLRWAHKWCRKETIAIRGNDDYHMYSRHQLTQMLPHLFEPEVWGSLARSGNNDTRSSTPAREGGDSLATYADLTRAYEKLNGEEGHLVWLRYVQCFSNWLDLGMEITQANESTTRKRTERAFHKLEKILAGKPLREATFPHVGRHVVSNAAAQARLGMDY